MNYDALGRLHLATSYTGRLNIFLRAQKFNGTTIATHVDDIIKIVSEDESLSSKSLMMLMSDNGPDFNPKSMLNMIYFYRLFKHLNLDLLAVFTYAARYSAYNCIEHLWAPLSNKLSGVTFNAVYPGDKEAPAKMTKISDEQRKEKEKVIFENAMTSMKLDHWKDALFDSFVIKTEVIPCGEDNLVFNDYENVKAFIKYPIRDIHKFNDLQKEYLTMFKHLDGRANFITFVKCSDRSCCPEFSSKDLEEHLNSTNKRLPEVKKSIDDHFNTFLENYIDSKKHYSDDNQPTVAEKSLGSCEVCPMFSFSSKTEKVRHKSMFHRRSTTKLKELKFKCKYPGCEKSFGSQPSLSRHQISSKHRKRDQTHDISKKKSLTKKRNRSILNVTRKYFSDSSSEDESTVSSSDNDDRKCNASRCLFKQGATSNKRKWIQCDSRDKWFHTPCMNLTSLSDEEFEEFDFVCDF